MQTFSEVILDIENRQSIATFRELVYQEEFFLKKGECQCVRIRKQNGKGKNIRDIVEENSF